MRMRQAIGLSLALFAISGVALAKQSVAADDRQHQPGHHQPDGVTEKTAKPEHPAAQHAAGRERKQAAEARHAAAQHRDANASRKDKANASRKDKAVAASKPAGEDRLAGSSQDPAALKVVGHSEIGMAAWYGGRFVGGRTASGAVLDSQTPTAAHRSLPLNSLVRVTNLRNGRSVICKVNDRGPWGRNRLIDVSPRAADELDMKHSGIAKVSVEPVASSAHTKPD
jgi:rare lipoprotein A